MAFQLLKTEGHARRGRMETVHGTIETPVFMNVGTSAAIKGGVSTMDLREIRCQVELSNTYHLHIRPGDDLICRRGGLHRFFNWDKPILTDSGGFQVFSLAKLRKITEEGVHFSSHMDGAKIFMGPEESMRIQSHLASTIAMAFDECVENPAPYEYVKKSCERTVRWLARCKAEMARLNALPETINPHQMLFGINQGGTYEDLRIENMCRARELDLDGYAIGGLAVGEETQVMYHIIDEVEPYMPTDKPRYLMGVGTPQNILEGVRRGKGELFDYLAANGGRAFVPREDEMLTNMAAERDGLAAEYYSITLAEDLENHLEGHYNRFNIAAAVAVGRYFDVADERIRHAVGSYVPDNNRSQRTETGRNTLIVDCYNANPSSMRASVANFLAEPPGMRTRRLLILGDMLELGAWSAEEHAAVIRLAAQAPQTEVMLVGQEFAKARADMEPQPARITLFADREHLIAALRTHPVDNALVLIKGSRGIGLEKAVGEL